MVADNFSTVGMSPEVAPAVDKLPEVETSTGMANAPLRLDGKDEYASAVNGKALARVMDIDVTKGSLDDLGTDGLALSTTTAEDRGLSVGDRVPVSFADGAGTTLTVRTIYDDADLVGPMLVSREAWAPHAQQASDVVVLVELADGVSMAEGEAAVQAVADRYLAPDVQTRQEYVESVASQIDQMLAVVYVLLVLAIIIALMGIANTLSLSIHERSRELGLLRAVGQSRRQLRAMVRGESVVVAAFGAAGGVGLGCFLGWALLKAISSSEENFTVFSVPVTQLAVVLTIGALVGVIAAWRPARRAAKLDILAAIATD
jgi:putative ABC transport system permease protein